MDTIPTGDIPIDKNEDRQPIKVIQLDDEDTAAAARMSHVLEGIDTMYDITVEAVMRAYETRRNAWSEQNREFIKSLVVKYDIPTGEDAFPVGFDMSKGVLNLYAKE